MTDDAQATSHWVRRSGRPQKAVKYFEDKYADVMEDTPDNTVKRGISDDATEDPVVSVPKEITPRGVRRSGRPRKPVKHFDDKYADPMEDVLPQDAVEANKIKPSMTSKQATVRTRANVPKVVSNPSPKSNTDPPSHIASLSAGPETSAPTALIYSSNDNDRKFDYGTAIAKERTNQEAALALLQLSRSWLFTAEIAESTTRESLKLNKVNNDVVAAAIALQKLTCEDAKLVEAHTLSTDQSPSSMSSASCFDSMEDVVLSAANKYKFTFDSSTGRTAAQLNSLLRPPPRMPRWPLDAASRHAMKMSYTQLGPRPREGLADKLVEQMEKQHFVDMKRAEDEDEEEEEKDM
jgi:hypothetical protein